ncbi:MAG: carboxypeptidase-like regulatory domain-containing protein [Bacteroidales bacterium]|nr:carboxypeptidase-like regulatory domain-containing protein [Bacteroidales bacterium]
MEDTLSHLSRCILLILLATGMAAVACERPEPVTTGNLEVVVTGENGVPLPGVKLGLGSVDYKYATDAKGSFLFKDLDEGFIRLYGRAEGYHDGTILAKVVAGETSRCDFPLNKVEPYLRWNYEGGATVDTYAAKGHTGIIIESNISWAVDGDPGNITFHQREGSGDGSIDFE